jgi:hypothetical protein
MLALLFLSTVINTEQNHNYYSTTSLMLLLL